MASGSGAAFAQPPTPEQLYAQCSTELLRIVRANHTAKGLALIVANRYGSWKDQKPLTGIEQDYVRMTETFKTLKYAIYGRRDASRGELLAMLEAVATFRFTPEFPYKRIVFVFSGHGRSDNVCTHTGDIPIAGIMDKFQPCNAPSLERLPKLFFIDACRGDLKMQAVVVPRGGEDVPTKIVAPYGNCLVAYSTMRRYQAYESTNGGVWLTLLAQKLLEVSKSIGDVLVDVNGALDTLYQSPHLENFLQQPVCESTLKEPVNFLAEATAPSVNQMSPGTQPPFTHPAEGFTAPMGALCAKPDHSLENPRLLPVESSQRGLQYGHWHDGYQRTNSADALDSLQGVDHPHPGHTDARPTQSISWQHSPLPLSNTEASVVVGQSPPPKRSQYSTDEASRLSRVTSWHGKKSHSMEEGYFESLPSNHRHTIFRQSSGPLELQCSDSWTACASSVQRDVDPRPWPSHSEQLLEKYRRDKWIQSFRCTVHPIQGHNDREHTLFKATVTLNLPGNTEFEVFSEDTAPSTAREKATDKAVKFIRDQVSSADELELYHDGIKETDHEGCTEETVGVEEQNDHSPSQAGSDNYRKLFNEWCQQKNIVPVRNHKISTSPLTLGQHWYAITYTISGQTGTFMSGYHPRKKDAEEEASSRAVQHETLKRAWDSLNLGKTPKKLFQEYCDKSHIPSRCVKFRFIPQAVEQQFQSEVMIEGTSTEAVKGDVFQNKAFAEHSVALRALHKFGIL